MVRTDKAHFSNGRQASQSGGMNCGEIERETDGKPRKSRMNETIIACNTIVGQVRYDWVADNDSM